MEQKPETRSQEHVIEINASPEAVWKTITEAEEIVRWFAPQAKVSPGVGGSIWMSWGPGMEGTTLIEAWEPGRHLRAVDMREAAAGCMSPETVHAGTQEPVRVAVDYHIEARAGGTVLRLVHSGFRAGESWDHEYEATRRGWPLFLRTLKHVLERHAGKSASNLHISVPFQGTITEAWAALTGPGGFRVKEGAPAQGRAWSVRTPDGEAYSGTTEIVAPPEDETAKYAELAGTLTELDDALLWLTLAIGRGLQMAGAMVIAHGADPARAEKVRTDLDSLFHTLFPAPA